MAQNPSTVKLMEASDSIKEQYSMQARNVDKTLLLRALELSNECDFNYKTSNNKRLSVELCLMKINANHVFMKHRAAAATKVRQSRELVILLGLWLRLPRCDSPYITWVQTRMRCGYTDAFDASLQILKKTFCDRYITASKMPHLINPDERSVIWGSECQRHLFAVH